MDTAILYLIFNRPDETSLVFDQIRTAKPKRLYIAADGARNAAEVPLCEKARKIATSIDWECDVKTLFRDENLGCGLAVSGAINWFFQHEEEGIILEDDCLPHQDFFLFCEQLLERFRNEKSVFMISGNNPFDIRENYDYYFSYTPSAWGWATWKRAWIHYDFEMKHLDDFSKQELFNKIYPNKKWRKYWLDHFHEIKERKINNWDYQLAFASFSNNGLCIHPVNNLVANIGFTSVNGVALSAGRNSGLKIENHPPIIKPSDIADQIIMKNLISRIYTSKQLLKRLGLFYIMKKIYKKLW